jgi:tetratricopeptide (TPR) repeat protein
VKFNREFGPYRAVECAQANNTRTTMKMTSFHAYKVLVLAACVLVSATSIAHNAERHDNDSVPLILGVLDFPNSGAPEAQDAFDRAVKLLHSFEFSDARDAFVEAQEIDPGFVMAIWGEAMSHNHPIWARQERDEALLVLAKLAPKGERRATEREERYLEAVYILFGEGDKRSRDIAYMNAMQKMYEDYPDDLEAAAFYSLSILGSVYDRDFRTYMKAASIAEEVFAKQPKHPGAAHYMIHSYDDQIHAPLGLRAAREYSKIAPSAAHAQHMVSHIYTSLGMWDEVVVANATSVRVSEESMQRAGKDPANRNKHALQWLHYALLQQGRFDEAADALEIMKIDVVAMPEPYNRGHNALMRAADAVDDPNVAIILQPTDLTDMDLYHVAVECFATAFSDISDGDLDVAKAELAMLDAHIDDAEVLSVEDGLHESETAISEDDYLLATIIAQEIEALLLFHSGDSDAAVEIMKSAAEYENGRAMYYGPPHVPKPPGELLGEMYLTLEQPEEAAAYFEASLSRNTSRSMGLLGLARAQEAIGDPSAAQTLQTLDANWQGDSSGIRERQYSWLTN